MTSRSTGNQTQVHLAPMGVSPVMLCSVTWGVTLTCAQGGGIAGGRPCPLALSGIRTLLSLTLGCFQDAVTAKTTTGLWLAGRKACDGAWENSIGEWGFQGVSGRVHYSQSWRECPGHTRTAQSNTDRLWPAKIPSVNKPHRPDTPTQMCGTRGGPNQPPPPHWSLVCHWLHWGTGPHMARRIVNRVNGGPEPEPPMLLVHLVGVPNTN